MRRVSPSRFNIEALHVRLRERIAELRPPVVMDVMRVFLEVSAFPCEQRLWSFSFAFDEDDGRVALLEARFAKHGMTNPSEADLEGYEVHLVLPHVLPAHAPNETARTAAHMLGRTNAPGALVERFVHAFAELDAYRKIELLEARSVDVYLL